MWILPIGIALALLLLLHPGSKSTPTRTLTYTGFVNEVTANKVSTATITSTGSVTGTLHGGAHYTSQIPTALNDTSLSPLLRAHKVQVTGTIPSTSSVLSVLSFLLPFVLIVGVFIWIGRKSRKQMGGGLGGLGGIMGIGKSKAKVYDEERPTTRFSDIADYE